MRLFTDDIQPDVIIRFPDGKTYTVIEVQNGWATMKLVGTIDLLTIHVAPVVRDGGELVHPHDGAK